METVTNNSGFDTTGKTDKTEKTDKTITQSSAATNEVRIVDTEVLDKGVVIPEDIDVYWDKSENKDKW